MVGQLLDAGADIDKGARAGETPLMLAVRGNHPEIMTMLIARGATLDETSSISGDTALILAADRSLDAAVRELLDAGASPNVRSRDGRTALSVALNNGDESLSKVLRAAGATD